LNQERITFGQQVSTLANDLGHSASALSLAWLMHKPAVATVIVGATRVEQLTDNLESASIKLDASSLAELDRLSDPFRHGEPFAVYRLS
jgi:aryl-alcohol dehydrogenase-like predicted oxidoreductase